MNIKNRWLIALSAVGIHISIGSVYAWSVFTKPLEAAYHWSLSSISWTFSIAILFLGLSAAFLGHFVEKYGPKASGTLCAFLFGIGMFGAGFATSIESLPVLYISYGMLGGIGLGVGYITPVSTLIKWFPDRRGFATGLAIMGFGFASMVSSPIINKLIGTVGISSTFYILAAVYFVIIFLSSQYLEVPPQGYMPKGVQQSLQQGKKVLKKDLAQLTANEAIKTKRFWALWVMFFINITCGIAILAVASPMGQELAGMSIAGAAALVGIMGIFNGFGRIAWASVSDRIGRPNVYTLFFAIQMAAFFALPHLHKPIAFSIIVCIIMSCYGGGFASIPAYIGDIFGTKQLGAIHGYMLTAWSAAGVAGPIFVSWIRETTGSYQGTLTVFSLLFIVSLVISFAIRYDIHKIKLANRNFNENNSI
ncbi:OFA family MFS transporter [Niallia sp. NCCP-28]|uniref:L-lactate MFS transporter n=1 Tax=Niallia sp. NCCP-28 TaxID=2934712 RepID=UPI0020881794|nr:OFA family MFS transporter [Niallia sp. NCCP-28]GKU82873.1 MFS transporter [Niallia sp. NCCP-28]